jgi:putative transposase
MGEDGDIEKPPDPCYRHRFPAQLINHAVWLCHFSLRFRDVKLIRAERSAIVWYESIRRWCLKFGAGFAINLRRRWPRPGDKCAARPRHRQARQLRRGEA